MTLDPEGIFRKPNPWVEGVRDQWAREGIYAHAEGRKEPVDWPAEQRAMRETGLAIRDAFRIVRLDLAPEPRATRKRRAA